MVLVFLAVILTVVLNGTVHGSLKIFKFNSITSQEIEFLKLLWGLIFVHLKTIILHRIQNSTPTHPLPVPMHTPMYTLMDICRKKHKVLVFNGFLGGSDGKESACNVGDLGLIPGLGRSPGDRHFNPLQYFAWRIPMDRGAWWATIHEVAESQTRLSD